MIRWLFFLSFIAFFTVPTAVLVVYSFAPGWSYPNVIPQEFSLRALHFVVDNGPNITRQLLSSIAYALCTTLLTLILCILPAHQFARYNFPGKTLLEGLLLAPALVPAMTFSMGVHYLFIRAGLADTFAGVVIALTVFSYPFMLRALITGFQSFGPEYELCARNLGANWWMRLSKVELPLLAPSIIAGGSVVFLIAFSDYFLVFLIGGGSVPSYTGYLFPFLNDSDRAVASLLTLVFLVVPIALFFLVEVTVTRMYRKRGMY